MTDGEMLDDDILFCTPCVSTTISQQSSSRSLTPRSSTSWEDAPLPVDMTVQASESQATGSPMPQSSATARKGLHSNLVHATSRLHKTKMCSFFLKGRCKRGLACSFAHGVQDLSACPDLRCTKMCPTIRNGGTCMAANCTFAHDEAQLRSGQLLAVGSSQANDVQPPLPIAQGAQGGCCKIMAVKHSKSCPWPEAQVDSNDEAVQVKAERRHLFDAPRLVRNTLLRVKNTFLDVSEAERPGSSARSRSV